ncbi:MAG: MerR family transcriptional regulator [Candidatus Cryptobacteroides sp.]|nr:MerR family transcriptional regulator [Bacteroidales bacterium]
MERLYYSIGETAEILGESISLVRFWSDTFSKFVKPHRNAKGNRMYTAADIEVLKQVHLLVKSGGMTLQGAAARLDADRKTVEDRVKAINCLKDIRSQLLEIRNAL